MFYCLFICFLLLVNTDCYFLILFVTYYSFNTFYYLIEKKMRKLEKDGEGRRRLEKVPRKLIFGASVNTSSVNIQIRVQG